MKTIIYIKFPSSKKDYAYLLDEGADKVPSPGDTLVFCRGASRYGAMTTNIQVTCLKQVMFLPDIVTSKLYISRGQAYSQTVSFDDRFLVVDKTTEKKTLAPIVPIKEVKKDVAEIQPAVIKPVPESKAKDLRARADRAEVEIRCAVMFGWDEDRIKKIFGDKEV